MITAPFTTAHRARRRVAWLVGEPSGPRPPFGMSQMLGLALFGLLVSCTTVGPALTTAGLAVGMAGALGWARHRRLELRRRRQVQLPEALERMAAALRTGSSLRQALHLAGAATEPPLGTELTDLALQTDRGRSMVDALNEWSNRTGDRATRLASTALILATRIGATPARAIDGVAGTLRERLAVSGERRALATQARTSAVVLSMAPVGFALLLGLTDSETAHVLLATPAGWLCLVSGVGLDLVGAVWMTRLIRSDES